MILSKPQVEAVSGALRALSAVGALLKVDFPLAIKVVQDEDGGVRILEFRGPRLHRCEGYAAPLDFDRAYGLGGVPFVPEDICEVMGAAFVALGIDRPDHVRVTLTRETLEECLRRSEVWHACVGEEYKGANGYRAIVFTGAQPLCADTPSTIYVVDFGQFRAWYI